MEMHKKNRRLQAVVILAVLAFVLSITTPAQERGPQFPLEGTWVLVRAAQILPDGTKATDPSYGPNARGLLIIDREGRYSLQIYRPDRPKFAAGDKRQGTADEVRSALMGASTHFGKIEMDAAGKVLLFSIEASLYPNWESAQQKREFQLVGDELTYVVPAAPGATRAVSVWRRQP